ncbi:winged helix-turn-helix domain-containing protein [Kitasatospora sp. NPDC049258]|uniref:winged helix-turn-helix domain-containing protein n=1 Tax=Kitasatospora sp. NPDC049258 TaxID=3155394 RepID=UPI00342B03E9
MLRIDLDARTLANTRFAISPLHTTADNLWHTHPSAGPSRRGWGALVRESLHGHGLTAVLRSLFTGSRGYIPDFIQPQPQAQEDSLDQQLHAVASVSPERLAREITLMLEGSESLHLPGGTAPRPLPDAILETPRTTTELAERHWLAASTVSYHLGVLHRSGLLVKTRTRHRVLYQQTARAKGLL